MRIHFSVDDVIFTLRWAWRNRPASIFDMDFFGTLREWRRRYGLTVCLYCFGSDGERFSAKMLPEPYVEELREQRDWLRVGYHGLYAEAAVRMDGPAFEAEQRAVAERFAGLLPETVRLHGWDGPREGIACARTVGGVKTLLCPELHRDAFYQLPAAVRERVETCGSAEHEGVLYVRTDYRLDRLSEDSALREELLGRSGAALYLYMHELTFRYERDALEGLWRELLRRGDAVFTLD